VDCIYIYHLSIPVRCEHINGRPHCLGGDMFWFLVKINNKLIINLLVSNFLRKLQFNTNVICPIMWTYDISAADTGTAYDYYWQKFLHGTGTLRCLQKEMATYRHWSMSLWRDPNHVPHCRILSPDKTEWRLILATLCGWRRCFVADQLWLMTRIREEEDRQNHGVF